MNQIQLIWIVRSSSSQNSCLIGAVGFCRWIVHCRLLAHRAHIHTILTSVFIRGGWQIYLLDTRTDHRPPYKQLKWLRTRQKILCAGYGATQRMLMNLYYIYLQYAFFSAVRTIANFKISIFVIVIIIIYCCCCLVFVCSFAFVSFVFKSETVQLVHKSICFVRWLNMKFGEFWNH